MRQHILDSPISYYAIYYFVRVVPRRICYWLGQLVGLTIFVFSKKDRANLAANIAMALDKPARHPSVRRTVRSIFSNYARYMVDFFLFPQLMPERIKFFFGGLEGETHLRRALARGKGVILVSAHVGNWEIGGSLLRALDYPLTVVGLPHNTQATNTLVHRLRQDLGIQIIEVGDVSAFSVVPILSALRENQIVAMIGDRDFFGTGRLVPFLGRRMRLPTGPVVLAMISGAALIPTFVLYQGNGHYRGILEPPLDLHTQGDKGDRDQIIEANLQQLARVFESYIRRHPDQWYCPDRLNP